jgi:fumarate hydratase subunit beta
MTNTIGLNMPLTKADIAALRAGDWVELSGAVWTARDAAHKRMRSSIEAGEGAPVDLKGQFVYYAGPCPARPGQIIGSIAATTSIRMDEYMEMLFQQGALGTIGKGIRAPFVAKLCKKYGGIYLLGIGGAAALGAKHITSCDVAAYDDLGTESIKRIVFDKMSFVVGIDTQGTVFQTQEIARYKKR